MNAINRRISRIEKALPNASDLELAPFLTFIISHEGEYLTTLWDGTRITGPAAKALYDRREALGIDTKAVVGIDLAKFLYGTRCDVTADNNE